jgi:hypothetical protein
MTASLGESAHGISMPCACKGVLTTMTAKTRARTVDAIRSLTIKLTGARRCRAPSEKTRTRASG